MLQINIRVTKIVLVISLREERLRRGEHNLAVATHDGNHGSLICEKELVCTARNRRIYANSVGKYRVRCYTYVYQ